MSRLLSWLARLYDQSKRAVLRDSTVILFERGPDSLGAARHDGTAAR